MEFTIDGITISAEAGQTILEAALKAGIYIPHLCGHPDLTPIGGCRLCSVEVDGVDEPVPSCKTIVEPDMVVEINAPKAEQTRKMAMELILASHPADCTGCPKYGKCELQSMYQYMGVGPERWRRKSRTVSNDNSNPLIDHLFTRCIRCGRCVRACRELRGVKVLDFQKTPNGIRVGIDGGLSLEEAGCRFCGACIEVCPTGSIMDTIGLIKEEGSYTDSVVPCRSACPAGVDIPRYLRYIKDGDFASATAVIREKVPFPETLGSICNHLCESQCKRNELNSPPSICKLKRAASVRDDQSWKKNAKLEAASGKKVAVIGAGPAGLTAAYYLQKKGHEVTLYEENEKAGGQCRYGIPAYRLPDMVLDQEIDVILETGINLKTETVIEKPKELLVDGFDAVLVATGTHCGNRLPLKGNDLKGVYVNADFLKSVRSDKPLPIGQRVMVLGGGNVAYDCARSAIRLGAKEVHLACLENRSMMTADLEEIEQGDEEGIILHDGQSFTEIIGDGQVEGVKLAKIKSFNFDENGKAQLELEENGQSMIAVDTVIFAVGQRPERTELMDLELHHRNYLKTSQEMETNQSGIFAAGDVVTGTKSVIAAIAAGRKSAEMIDRFLGGNGDITEILLEFEEPAQYLGKCEGFSKIERHQPELLAADIRCKSFAAIEEPFTAESAQSEAARCLQCDLRLTIDRPKLWNEYSSQEGGDI